MSITPWQTRWDTLGIPKDTAIQGEIDELRAALQERAAAKPPAVLMNQLVNDKLELSAKLAERDAEIERLTLGWNATNVDVLHHAMTIAAQRKVLEQALGALIESLDDVNSCRGDQLHGAGYPKYDRRIASYDEQITNHEAAITAIQGVLNA